jgi:hypothetical protein
MSAVWNKVRISRSGVVALVCITITAAFKLSEGTLPNRYFSIVSGFRKLSFNCSGLCGRAKKPLGHRHAEQFRDALPRGCFGKETSNQELTQITQKRVKATDYTESKDIWAAALRRLRCVIARSALNILFLSV